MFIKEAEIFRGIPSHIINEIAEIATEGVFQTGHVLFHKGDFADSLIILQEGEIDITIDGQKKVSLRVDQPGQMFGWSALVEPNQHTATAKCLKDSMLSYKT